MISLVQKKTSVPLTIPLPTIVGNALYDYLEEERKSDSRSFFITATGKDFKSSDVSHCVKKVFMAAGIRQNKGDRLLDAWTPANSGSDIPALTTSNGADEGRMSSYFVENGSYAKLRTLQLGYTLPASLVKKVLLSRARIYVSGDNLWTIKSKSLTCSDPENTSWSYPHTASFTFGIQVGF